MYLVVIARPKSGKPNKIYKGQSIFVLLNKIRNEHRRAPRTLVGWTDEMDSYVLANHRNYSRSQLAAKMSDMYARKITKNSVVTRCGVLGLSQRRRT